jgi:hypothetical protein
VSRATPSITSGLSAVSILKAPRDVKDLPSATSFLPKEALQMIIIRNAEKIILFMAKRI